MFRLKTAAAASAEDFDFDGSTEALFDEIQALTERNRDAPDPETERRVLRLRHLAGIRAAGRRAGRPGVRGAGRGTPPGEPMVCPTSPPPSSPPSCCAPGSCATAACSSAASCRARPRWRSPPASTARSRSASASRARRPRRAATRSSSPHPRFGQLTGRAVDPGRRRRAGHRLAHAELRDGRAVPSRPASRASRRLPRRARADLGRRRRRCARPSRACPARGTRTACSWAPSARSTCGCRCPAAATRRPASTSSRAGSTTLVGHRHRRGDARLSRCRSEAEEAAGGVADRPADLRAGRRALLRRDVPAPDRFGAVDAEPALRDRELVLRRLRVPAGVLPPSRSRAVRPIPSTTRTAGASRWRSMRS